MQDLYWRITRDTANTGEYAADNCKGTEGPSDCNQSLPTPVKFRLITDDWPEERAAYYGVAANDESVEYALDGFGAPDVGMTASDLWVPAGKPCFWRENCHAKTKGKGHWERFTG